MKGGFSMAQGVSGWVAFTKSGKTLRVYYSQTFTPGVARSTVTITKVTMQSDISYGTTRFFFDGKILVNGQVVFSRSVSGSDGGVCLEETENIINLCTNGVVYVDHSAPADISIQLERNTYSWPYLYCSYHDDFTLTAGTQTVTLAAIPMASKISAVPAALGNEMAITLAKAASGMTDTVSWQCGSQSGVIAENTPGTSLTWTPPVALAAQAPNGTSVSITLTAATKNGDTPAGSDSVTLSCPIPESVRPTASLAVSDEAGYLAAFGSFIRGQSKARVVTTAAGAFGSTIAGVSLSCGTLTGSGESALFELPYSGTVVISATVTDSRGRTAKASAEITVADYSPPLPEITALYRCDASGNAAPDGAWARAVLSCAVTSLGGANCAAYVLQYRVRGTETWTEKAVAAPGNAVFEAGPGLDYQVRLRASDSFTTSVSGILTLPAAYALLDFDRKNKAVGIGRRAGDPETLSLGLPIKMGAHRITDLGTPTENTDAATVQWVNKNVWAQIYKVGAIYISAVSTSPASLFGGTWEMITNRFLLAAGDLYAAGATGGEAAHALTGEEGPKHTHLLDIYTESGSASGGTLGWGSGKGGPRFGTTYAGGGQPHNNMPPYLAVYMWKRVA